MNSKSTWRLFFVAIALFAFIYFFELRPAQQKLTADKEVVFPKLAASAITSVEIQTTNFILKAERTNETWRLTRPFYPAQSTPIEAFLKAVTTLPKRDVINASEVSAQPGRLKDYGLDPPVAILTLNQG